MFVIVTKNTTPHSYNCKIGYLELFHIATHIILLLALLIGWPNIIHDNKYLKYMLLNCTQYS